MSLRREKGDVMSEDNTFRLFDDVEKDLTPNFGNWEVKDNGDLLYHGKALATKEFPIDCIKTNGITAMMQKHWGEYAKDGVDFYFAYLEAMRRAGYQSLTIDLTCIHNSTVK